MKNKLLLLLMGVFLASTMHGQSDSLPQRNNLIFPVHIPLAGFGFGIQATVFPTTMYGEDELFYSIAPCLDRHWVGARAYIGLQMVPQPNGIVLGYQQTFWGVGKKVSAYLGLDAQLGKIALRQSSSCPQFESRSRDLMLLGSLNLGMEVVLPFDWVGRWVAHAQVGIADMEVAGHCPANEVNAIGRIGLRRWF